MKNSAIKMENMKGNIDPKEVVNDINSILSELRNSPIDKNMSSQDIAEIKEELLKVEELALKIKLKMKIEDLFKKEPQLSSREVIIKIFEKLPPKTSKELLPNLTEFIIEKWDELGRKMAA